MTVFFDTAENLHPYECDGRGGRVHCDRRVTENHDPAGCALCDPEYDGGPAVSANVGRSVPDFATGDASGGGAAG